MKTVGIIVEYNPLHYGHVYHFQQSKIASEADAAICVMSGNFLQRGEPALVNKWARAEMALQMGADVVIELPIAYCTQPAEWFAFGAISALDATGVVDSVCFGSESGNIEWLQQLARILHQEPIHFQQLMEQQLKKGINYPTAYSTAIEQYTTFCSNKEISSPVNIHRPNPVSMDGETLAKPNNILGLHYLIALERLKSSIQPLTIQRQKAGYHQIDITDGQIASATAIRHLLFEKQNLFEASAYLPAYTFDILQREWSQGRAPMNWDRFAHPLLHQLISHSPQRLETYAEVSEGLENRLKRILPQLKSNEPHLIEQLLQLTKTKRYTRTKLQRTLLRILLHHTKLDLHKNKLQAGVPYLRILGFSSKGRELLKRMKKTAKVPLVTKVTKADSPFLEMDIRAASVYALAYPNVQTEELFRDYYQSPIQFG